MAIPDTGSGGRGAGSSGIAQADGPHPVAAIDAGSNAVRFVVADVRAPQSHTVLHNRREPIRLGHRVFTHGSLDRRTMDRAVGAMRSFRRDMDALGVVDYRAVATSATREARNKELFLGLVRREAGIVLEPISGQEEARLVHLAVQSRVDFSRERSVLADLGGGSVEIALVDETGILWSRSFPIGTVRLLETLGAEQGCHDALLAWVRRQLRSLAIPPGHAPTGPLALAATGGNIEAIAMLARCGPTRTRPGVLSASRLFAVIDLFRQKIATGTMGDLGLRQDRVDVILPAATVYGHILKLVGATEVIVPGVGVQEGLLLELAARRESGAPGRA